MGEHPHPLLIISFKVLLRSEGSPLGPQIVRRLARLTREGVHLLLTASEPDQWFPTRGNADDVLGAQGRLQEQIVEVGGNLDGVYYVPRSVFTQDRKRAAALRDILGRYKVEAGEATLISSSRAFLKAADRLGLRTRTLEGGEAGMEQLDQLLEGFPD